MTNPNPDPNPNQESESSNSKTQKGFEWLDTPLKIIISICTLFSIIFGLGFGAKGLLDVCLSRNDYRVLDEQAKKSGQLITENTSLTTQQKKLEQKNSDLTSENKKLKDEIAILKGCTGDIKSPINGASVSPKPKIEVSVGQCRKTNVWLVASPNGPEDTGLDCYFIGEPAKGKTSFIQAHPLQQKKPYLVRLIQNNKNIGDIPKKKGGDGYAYNCSDLGFADSLSEVTLNVN